MKAALRAGLPLLALALSGCAGAPVMPEALEPYRPTGSVQRGAQGASFNRARVLNPSMSLARHLDGSWTGWFALAGTGTTVPLDVSVTPDAIRGVGFVLVRLTPAPGRTVYEGTFNGKRFHFELSAEAVAVKTAGLEGTYAGPVREGDTLTFHAGSDLTLTGEATAVAAPPWPQLALALVAAFY